MAASDALPFPRKNVAYRLYFVLRSETNTLITSWTAADTELSGDGGAFADATNEATEIGTSGVGYLDLTAGEMNFDSVVVKTTVSNATAVPTVTPLYPMDALNLTQINVSNPSGDAIVATSTGGNGAGMRLTGNGTGQGQVNQGGATASGVLNQGGATSGNGVDSWAQADGFGEYLYGIGTGFNGLRCEGDGGPGLEARALAGDMPGLYAQGFQVGAGLQAVGGATGVGVLGIGNGGAADISGVLSAGSLTAAALDSTIQQRLGIVGNGTASSVTDTTIVVAAATGALYQPGSVIGAYGSTQAYWQYRLIVSVAVDTITVDEWEVTPTGTVTYVVYASAPAAVDAPPSVDLTADALADLADAVWDEAMAGHVTAGTAGDLLADAASGGSAATVAAAVWDAALADYAEAGSTGEALAASTATALLDLANGVESDWTVRESLRVMAAALAALVSGCDANAPVFRDLGNTKNRISAATDDFGNRTGITYDKS